jgi:outer membrane protein assembly factor BamB
MRRALLALPAAVLLLGGPAAHAVPIPESPGNSAPAFTGAAATAQPIESIDPPRHPYMAPNGSSNLHVDAYQTDAHRAPGPLGRDMSRTSTYYNADCASITFDAQGRLVTVCVGLQGPTLRLLAPGTLAELASFPLPGRQALGSAPSANVFTDFAGGGYFYLDERDRAVLPTTTRHVFVVRETAPAGFALDADYDLTTVVPAGDKIFSALPDWQGRIWFVSNQGRVGFVEPATGRIQVTATGEAIANSFAVDEEGGVFLVTEQALYRFAAVDGRPQATWRSAYANSGIAKPGQVGAGSGTTPTLTQRGHVAITDNADPMNVVLYDRRAGTEICRVPVFAQGASATDQSLVAFGDALVVENNYGYSGPAATEQGATTTPGLWRVDYDPATGGCAVAWRSEEIAPTVVPKVSLATGLLYTYTKPAGERSDPWYLTAIDARTGKTAFKRLAGTGLGFNNNYAPVTLAADGTAYLGVLGGMVALRDGAAPPPAPAAAACAALPGPAAVPAGADLRLVPAGLADVQVDRVVARGDVVRLVRVHRATRAAAASVLPGRGLGDGTYLVSFRSGADVRRVVVRRVAGRFRAGPAVQVVRRCGRVEAARPLFGHAGLLIRTRAASPVARVRLVYTRTGGGAKRIVRTVSAVANVRLKLARGTWRVAVAVDGRPAGSLTSRRP